MAENGRSGPHHFDGTILWRAFFSLALAIMLWVWVTNLEDPETSRRLTIGTPALLNRAADLVVLEQDRLPTVTVDLHGPRSVVQAINVDEVRAEIDLGSVTTAGTHELPVKVRAPRRVRVTNITPATLRVSVDRLTGKTFPLEVVIQPSPASYSIGRVEKAIDQVTVKGPAAALNRVARVVLPVALGDRRETFEAQFTPEARDAGGARISGLTVEPSTVNAVVTVNRVGRTVSVVANLVGAPPEGYRIANTTVSPSFVVVDGPPETLNQLIQISTAPIDVSNQTKPFSRYDVQLVLPSGIRVIDAVTVNVQVQIDRQQLRQQFPPLRITTVNVGSGLRATVVPPELTVTITGPVDRLRQLSASDIQIDVDLQGYGIGSYDVRPRVTLPPELQIDGVPATVRVQIERAATPAPVTPTPGGSPAPGSPRSLPPTPPNTPGIRRVLPARQ